eukprot:gene11401-25976_t
MVHIVISCPWKLQKKIPSGYDVMQLFWKTGKEDDAWWGKWQQRVHKKLDTATSHGGEVHAYAIFSPTAQASSDERGYIRSMQDQYPTVQFHFTHIDQL